MIKGFKLGSKIEKYDYDSLENLPPIEEMITEQVNELRNELQIAVEEISLLVGGAE